MRTGSGAARTPSRDASTPDAPPTKLDGDFHPVSVLAPTALCLAYLIEAIESTDAFVTLSSKHERDRTGVLSRAAKMLPSLRIRVIHVQAPKQGKLGLPDLVRTLVAPVQGHMSDHDSSDQDDIERAFEALTVPGEGYDRVALLVDGSQTLSAAFLRYIQLTSQLGPHLRVVLAGPPGFQAVLARSEFDPLRRRLTCELTIPATLASENAGAIASSIQSQAHEVAPAVILGHGRQDQTNFPRSPAIATMHVAPNTSGPADAKEVPLQPRIFGSSEIIASRPQAVVQSRWEVWTLGGLGVAAVLALLAWQLAPEVMWPHVAVEAGGEQRPSNEVHASSVTVSTDVAAVIPRAPEGQQAAIAILAPQVNAPLTPMLLEMVMVPGGTFLMGSNDDPSERPVHTVAVAPFLLAKHAITVREWQECVEAKECTLVPKGKPDEPVMNASWDDARQYAAWLSKVTNESYRLPREAEWEYAARAGTRTRYSWGNAFVPGKASCKNCGGEPVNLQQPPRVDAYPSNLFGLYGMGGGVAEWVADCWHRDYQNAPNDGSTPWDVPGCRERVLRGGSWMNEMSELRVSSREFYDASVRYPTHGFRVARSLPQPQ